MSVCFGLFDGMLRWLGGRLGVCLFVALLFGVCLHACNCLSVCLWVCFTGCLFVSVFVCVCLLGCLCCVRAFLSLCVCLFA